FVRSPGELEELRGAGAIDQREIVLRTGRDGRRTGNEREGSGAGDAEVRSAEGCYGRSLDALDDGHWSTGNRKVPQIERHGEQDAAERVRDVSRRQIPAFASARDEGLSFRAFQRLRHDQRFVPSLARRGKGEEYPVATGQHLRAGGELVDFDTGDHR